MKLTIFLVVTASLFIGGCVGTAHQNHSEVSAAEVGIYKLGIETGCRDTGRGRGDPEVKVDAQCKCAISILEKGLTEDDWRKATFYAQQRREREEYSILAPHMAAIKECQQRVSAKGIGKVGGIERSALCRKFIGLIDV